MSRQSDEARSMQREIALIIVMKLVLLILIWHFFFSANRVDVNAEAAREHVLSSPQENKESF